MTSSDDRRITTVSLFCGAGGESCGKELAFLELAAAMGFPQWYRWSTGDGTPLTRGDVVKMIGNACPVNTVKELIKSVVGIRPEAFGLRKETAC